MLERQTERVTIELETALIRDVEKSLSKRNIPVEDFMTEVFRRYLKREKQQFDDLKEGYIKMGTLNLKISEEFNQCDVDPEEYINY